MDEQLAWQADRNRAVREQAIARGEAVERAADEARQADTEARHDALWDAARRTGQPVPTHGDILARARDAFVATEDGRDNRAAYGSAARPAMYATAADGSPVEVTARPVAGVRRSVSDAQDDALLARARELSEDGFMAVQIARFHACRPGSAAAERDEMERRAGELGYSEISR